VLRMPRLPDGVTSMPNQQDDRAGPSRSSGLAWRSHRRTGRPTARCVLGQLLYSLVDSHRRPLPLPPESPDATAPGSATSQAAFESTGGVPPNCEPPEREWERDDLAIPFPDWRGRGLQNRRTQVRALSPLSAAVVKMLVHASRKGESAQGPLGRREGLDRCLDSDSSRQHTRSAGSRPVSAVQRVRREKLPSYQRISRHDLHRPVGDH
jgi:hypothetical protein